MGEDLEHEVKISFSKTKAQIDFSDGMRSGELAHAIALLILALDNKQKEPILEHTIDGVIDAINNIKAPK